MDKLYLVEIEGTEYPVRISEGAEGLQVQVGEEPAQAVGWTEAQPGLYSLLLDGASHQARVAPDAEEPGGWTVDLGTQRIATRVQTERERRLSRIGGVKQAQSGEFTVKAPMPGLVRVVAVAVGDVVAQGGRLLLLEAMKMENEIAAPRAGTVKTIHVAPGDTVDSGRPLVVLE